MQNNNMFKIVCIGALLAGVNIQNTYAKDETIQKKSLKLAIEEVLVTAQKRGEQYLSDVPVSISVLGGDELDSARFEGIAEAIQQVAGVNLFAASQSGGTKLSVRGVTAGGPLLSGSSAVGYYIDDAPFGLVKSAVVPDANAYDLRQIEVLRGPQGTLYGASSLNGVVRIITHDVNLDEFEFKARTSISNTDGGGNNYRLDTAINMPIVPGKLAARAVVGHNDLSGWIDKPFEDQANDGELKNYRLKVKFEPTDNLSMGLSTWKSEADWGAPSIALDNGTNPSIVDETVTTDYSVHSFTVEYDFFSFSVHSATNYIDYSNGGDLDIANVFTLFTGLDSEVFSQEIRFVSTLEGNWQWSLGGFYRDAEDRLRQTLPGILPAPIDFTDKSESVAVFGEVTRALFDDKLELTVGLRYFEDEVTVIENSRHTGVASEPLIRTETTFDTVTPRIVLTWFPDDDLTLYTSYSEGFRSGFDQNAIVLTTAPDFEAVTEDSLTNYEIGLKGSFLDSRVAFEAALYYIDWDDLQQLLTVPVGSGAAVAAPVNGDSASGMGLDFALTLKVTERLEFGLTAGWNDLTMDSQVVSDGVALFESGDRLVESPEYTAGVTGSYHFPIGANGLEGDIAGSINYHSELLTRTVSGSSVIIGEGDEIVNARFGFSIASPEHWVTTLYVDNAFNEDGAAQVDAVFAHFRPRLRPRTVGFQIEYNF